MKKDEEWLKAAQENFRSAIESGDISLAKNIISDILDAGFPDVARAMTAELKDSDSE